MLKVAISGSTGLVGSRIQELLYHDVVFIPLLRSKVDIADKESVSEFVGQNDFDIMLHLAGYTAVDQAEKEREECKKINVDGTRNLFDEVTKKKKKFIYISTDFVFDGKNSPYDESSQPNPIGWYAKTKYEGEKIIGNKGMIVRIAYPYRASYGPKKDLIKGIRSYLEEGKKIAMLTDTIITPTFIDDIAFSLKHLLVHFSNEVYHVVGSGSYSPYDIAQKIAEAFKLDKSLIGKTTYDEFYKNSKIRPRDLTIKSKKNYSWKMKSIDEGLEEIKRQVKLKLPQT
ncbi:hypothetical protein A3G67_05045 [Candidatus Roizmanbacteria bacterium RIFCSPLOWO2_12_FULL_40_12]|uniref:dTDP-4-dehydrorhamnose reductase n=1 Tax=Candidatus Roizmanbacteria bacterium RIFCSPLOWO2_01_FULL_40_42 TaxID=1802066 RepID=A0A1F7J4G3_9BACT|nr:MAG: hypothetical protein A2779_04105 [Candidatus Roizmanbacteria bacterium RIFCSPHIGHO2_01_FULL_40_98]OGK27261.1 MAG: hypothetical protein A3C31_04430 [Candidatus Roizmanbacteria bacterium RIFCSPHIGHO2_02_FULL_40_53]OGK30867.1 MAG: hypothetical protein A2W49_02610 [Candidatus Roizmanbacteria bacterium RIFCSPHIGHO2_12_41_18]OGK36366.1 MAG: hypothetical protein A3E69_02055 [Candidatus Roizmanbacteria bacterium RIFCSPHIGHO2_12_FULL_40_130]OGK50494.1 MAG: hypothetical protein A3B50_01785 [Candi